ncbi:hypothetical protein AAGF08_09730 [Algoriphagus sp. SE2]|uniref:hypothetical protein n=1 Tax=Algoriphagus sp. SE2 TaxID=3141536 RepID=UPI0031CD2F44
MEKLKDAIRKIDFDAESYGGFNAGDFQFQRMFFMEEKTLEQTFEEINVFLTQNGFEKLDFSFFKRELSIENEVVSVSADPYVNESDRRLILTIQRFDPIENPIDRVFLELIKLKKKFSDPKFNSSKDLSLVLSKEALKFSELFVLNGNESPNPERLKEHLANMFFYGLLILGNHGFDFEEILMEKIRKGIK